MRHRYREQKRFCVLEDDDAARRGLSCICPVVSTTGTTGIVSDLEQRLAAVAIASRDGRTDVRMRMRRRLCAEGSGPKGETGVGPSIRGTASRKSAESCKLIHFVRKVIYEIQLLRYYYKK